LVYNLYDKLSVTVARKKLSLRNLITLENIEGAINNGQSRETGNMGYTRRKKKRKENHNTI